MSLKTKYLFLPFALALIVSCANIQAPSGGPPDITPPEITVSSIRNRAINFHEKTITLAFNKYMNNTKVIEGAFISPKAEMEFDWSGKSLEVSFPKALDSNTAYILTFGADFTDYYGNKPKESLTLVFSTGDKIDSGYVSGALIDDSPSGKYIFGYRIDNINPDTLNPSQTKARYLTQIGSNGEFKLQALPDGKYRIFVVKDELKDGLINDVDAFGSAVYDIIVKNGVPDKRIAMRINKPYNSKGLTVFFVESESSYKFKTNFSDDIDSLSLSPESASLMDSASGEKIILNYAGLLSPKLVEYFTEKPLDTNKAYKVQFTRATANSIKSVFGLGLQDTNLTHYFHPSSALDTNKIKIAVSPFADSAKSVFLDKELKFAFNKPIKNLDSSKFQLINFTKNDTTELKATRLSSSLILAKANAFESNSDYALIANFHKATSFEGNILPDTLVRLNFKTEEKKEWGSLSFTLKDPIDSAKAHIVIFKNIDKNRIITLSILPGEKKTIDLPAGAYNVEAFCDTDGDGKYSYGAAFPYKHSERFIKLDKPFTIKSRWSVENFTILMNN